MKTIKFRKYSLIYLVLSLLLIATLCQAGPLTGGSVSGKVTFKGTATPSKIKIDKDLEICGTKPRFTEDLIVSEAGGLKNVVVQIVGAKGDVVVAKGKDRASITQKGCQFFPHVQVIPVGSRINILNTDGIAHNIHTLSTENPSFNQQQPGAKKKMVTKKNDFAVPEIIPLKCDIHGWMRGWLVVGDHPYYAVSEESGTFKISGVPAGSYTVEFWHEKLGKQTQKVTVTDGADAAVNAVFTDKK